MRNGTPAGGAVLGLLAILAACAPPTEMKDLVGTYVLSIQTDTLRLRASGQYTRVHAQIGTPAHVAVDTGRWRVSNNRRMVALSALPSRWPEHGYNPATGVWHAPDTSVRRMVALVIGTTWKREVTLSVKPELGWQYRRTKEASSTD